MSTLLPSFSLRPFVSNGTAAVMPPDPVPVGRSGAVAPEPCLDGERGELERGGVAERDVIVRPVNRSPLFPAARAEAEDEPTADARRTTDLGGDQRAGDASPNTRGRHPGCPSLPGTCVGRRSVPGWTDRARGHPGEWPRPYQSATVFTRRHRKVRARAGAPAHQPAVPQPDNRAEPSRSTSQPTRRLRAPA